MLAVALGALAPKGRLLQMGYISEYPHNPDAAEETAAHDLKTADLFWKKETVTRRGGDQTIYGNAWPSDFSEVLPCKDRVLGLFEEGKLKSLVDDTHFEGLEAVPAAIEHMLSGTTIGKVVIKIQ